MDTDADMDTDTDMDRCPDGNLCHRWMGHHKLGTLPCMIAKEKDADMDTDTDMDIGPEETVILYFFFGRLCSWVEQWLLMQLWMVQ